MSAAATQKDIRRWREYLAAERAEALVYRDLGNRKPGTEGEILRRLAEAEDRHASHWVELLGPAATPEPRASLATKLLGFFAKRFGSVFILAMMQRAESRSPYEDDPNALESMAADERVHGEVVRALASEQRLGLAGGFRAAVFGMNDGLVSNLSLVLGVVGTGLPTTAILATGLAGLLAGALSMAAGELISVSSQRELIDSSKPDPETEALLPDLDLEANELALVYRARGMSEADSAARAESVIAQLRDRRRALATGEEVAPVTSALPLPVGVTEGHDAIGSAWGAAGSSFLCFAVGALLPILPYLCGASGWLAVVLAVVLVGLALLVTGALTGVLSGASPGLRALRQLGIGYGAALITYLLGLAFGRALG